MGFFGTGAALITDINLLIQIVAIIFVIIGIVYKVKRKVKIHGYLMAAAIFMHFITFIIAMGPAFSESLEFYTSSTDLIGVQAMWIHAIAGSIGLIIGILCWDRTCSGPMPDNISKCGELMAPALSIISSA